MDSWDDDEFEVPTFTAPPPAETAVTSWEDEEEEEEEEEIESTSTTNDAPKGPLKPKQLKKLKMKELEQKREHDIAMTKARLAAQANETDAERKAREKASIEEADFEAAIDAFGPSAKKAAAAATGATGTESDDLESVINGMRLISLADHERLGEVVANRISTSNVKYALETIKVLLTRGSINLTADDIKDLTTILNVIKNEKIAASKPKTKKKKVTGRQGYANVERTGGHEDDYGDYDDYDDFM